MAWESIDRLTPPELPAENVLDADMKKAIDEIAAKYPARQAALLPALHIVQGKLGKISEKAMIELGELLGISPAEVRDTASFYDLYSLDQRGKHLIAVCESLSCELCGCNELLEALEEKLGIKAGQTTADGKFTLIELQCLGACDFAPAMLVDQKLHKTVKPEQLDKILGQVDK